MSRQENAQRHAIITVLKSLKPLEVMDMGAINSKYLMSLSYEELTALWNCPILTEDFKRLVMKEIKTCKEYKEGQI